ncbi:hypothetical protein [Vreelandella massiliensis]|uniref:hypothetical protein n=1 Tax=Vreelandella massiliensis TaxID=1816686 RepID=UPI00096ABE5B|nr:hypothetical protein [Halomonas massiliensis]
MPEHAHVTHEPVRYFEGFPEQLPGQQHFTCTRLSAILSAAECAARHALAQDNPRADHLTCRACPIGQVHANGLIATRETLSQATHTPRHSPARLCVRCGRLSPKLVRKTLCVSCYNREGEAKKGRNAKGKVPVTYAPLRLRRVGLELPDGEIRWALFEAQTWLEPLLRGLRAYPGAKLYDGQPSDDSPWNVEAQRFEYRDEQSQALAMDVEERDGYLAVRYRPALAGELPAPVVAPVSLFDPGFVAEWLRVSEEGHVIGNAWRAVAYGCSACRQGGCRHGVARDNSRSGVRGMGWRTPTNQRPEQLIAATGPLYAVNVEKSPSSSIKRRTERQ